MAAFAKIFEHEEYGQILVMKQSNDGQPALVVMIEAPEPCGYCELAFNYSDDDEGEAKLDAAFDKVNEVEAAQIVRGGIWPTVEKLMAGMNG